MDITILLRPKIGKKTEAFMASALFYGLAAQYQLYILRNYICIAI